jgi:hypothetical protein
VSTPSYAEFREHLRLAGCQEVETGYEDPAFGSWFIALEGTPQLRIVWDGRDGRLIVQYRRAADGTWKLAWTGVSEAEQKPEVVVKLHRLFRTPLI